MTAAQIIGEIEGMEAPEQDHVIRFAITLAERRRMSAAELSELAGQLPGASGPRAGALKGELERGFYGFPADA